MVTNTEQRIRIAKLVGSWYFLLLGLVNFIATFIYSEIKWLDSITLAICILPLLINKKIFLLIFGIVAAFISFYLFLACLAFSLNPEVQTSQISFFMGFLLTGSALFSSLLLIFVGHTFATYKVFKTL